MAKKSRQQLPIAKNESVEFSMEYADREDLKALQRAKKADKRQEKD
ncbi:YfhD family protein [Bacillus horti]|uniref:YfhD family protein n=1 Tax=Caldalkalibacillus horti TaxID=77523 RepID=A0ABT9W5M9_9BACI|nr:YfhD family protein [Bacillus horti]MDQ0168554.1 hypothetical protein [Bacillus horti]